MGAEIPDSLHDILQLVPQGARFGRIVKAKLLPNLLEGIVRFFVCLVVIVPAHDFQQSRSVVAGLEGCEEFLFEGHESLSSWSPSSTSVVWPRSALRNRQTTPSEPARWRRASSAYQGGCLLP